MDIQKMKKAFTLMKNTVFKRTKVESQISWKRGYGQLVNVLFLYGINTRFSSTEETAWHKIVLLLCPVCLHLLQGFGIMRSLSSFKGMNVGLIITIAYHLLNTTSVTLWYVIYFKRGSLKRCMEQLHALSVQHNIHLQNRSLAVNVAMVIALLVPEIFLLTSTIFVSDDPGALRFFASLKPGSFGLISMRFFVSTLKATIRYTFPGAVAVVCCTVYCKFSDIVSKFNENIQSVDVCKTRKEIFVIYVTLHQKLCAMANQVETVLSPLSFLLISIQVLSMFLAFSSFFVLKLKSLRTSHVLEAMPSITLVPLSVVCTVYSASRVAKQHAKTLVILQAMQDKLSLEFEDDWKYLGLVKRMKENRFPLMTAGGVVELTPSLIFTVFGDLLTYGLLFLSLQG